MFVIRVSPNTTQIAKALVIRNDSTVMRYVDRLFELFGDAEVSWDAARALGTVVATDKILTKKNHAIIKVRNPNHERQSRLHEVPANSVCPKVLPFHSPANHRRCSIINR